MELQAKKIKEQHFILELTNKFHIYFTHISLLKSIMENEREMM